MDCTLDVEYRLRRFAAVTVFLLALAVGSLGTLALRLQRRGEGAAPQAAVAQTVAAPPAAPEASAPEAAQP